MMATTVGRKRLTPKHVVFELGLQNLCDVLAAGHGPGQSAIVAFHSQRALLAYITQYFVDAQVPRECNVTPLACSSVGAARLFVEKRNTCKPHLEVSSEDRQIGRKMSTLAPMPWDESVPCPKTVRLNSVFFPLAGAIWY